MELARKMNHGHIFIAVNKDNVFDYCRFKSW
jgi:hypothetical protein